MTSAVSSASPLYPPTVRPSEAPLSRLEFLRRVVRNPLTALPRAAFEEPITLLRNRGPLMVWVSDPALLEEVLLERVADLEKTPVEKRVFSGTMRDGVLTAEGKLWRWQRRTMAPMFRHSEILHYIPPMAEAAGEQIARWHRSPAGAVHPIDREMSETTFAIIARTMLAGGTPCRGRNH